MKSVVLVNLGSPRSPGLWDVFCYLTEFLTDGRVIELPFWQRQLLVRGVIVPRRFRESAASYRAIWTEEGAPLLSWGYKVRDLLAKALGWPVFVAMRYQQPSIKAVLAKIRGPVVVVPLFPQYAEATSGSVIAKVRRYRPDAEVVLLSPDHPLMIQALASQIPQGLDHLVMSFHGLPLSQDRHGYSRACYRTAEALGKEISCPYTVTFQSRLGKEPWLMPYTSDLLPTLKGHVGVISPAFVADCLETLQELGIEYRSLYQGPLIPCLNDHPLWIQSLKEQIVAAVSAS